MPPLRNAAAQLGVTIAVGVLVLAGSTWAQNTAPLLSQQVLQTPLEPTDSQLSSNQLNQLFSFETTPDKSAAHEGYLSAQFSFQDFAGNRRQYRETLQGEYGITDQWAAGAIIPVQTTDHIETHTGVGDVTFFGQYKLDRLVNPEVVNVTAQLDLVLPTGSRTNGVDTGHFGVRPLLVAYKDFGAIGDGQLGVYGLIGATFTTDSDFRAGVAITYEIDRIAGVLELFNQTGDRVGKPLFTVTPGFAFRQISPLELVVGFPVGINDNSPHWGVDVKLTYAFGR